MNVYLHWNPLGEFRNFLNYVCWVSISTHTDHCVLLRFLAGVVLSQVAWENVLKVLNGPIVESPSKHFVFWREVSQLIVSFCKDALVQFLVLHRTISVNSLLFSSLSGGLGLLGQLWLRKSIIKHVLVVWNESHLLSKAGIPVILRLGKQVHFLLSICGMTLSLLSWVIELWIISEVIVEGPLISRWLIHSLEATSTIRDVGVSTSSIVGVVHWLRVNHGDVVTWSWFSYNEWP